MLTTNIVSTGTFLKDQRNSKHSISGVGEMVWCDTFQCVGYGSRDTDSFSAHLFTSRLTGKSVPIYHSLALRIILIHLYSWLRNSPSCFGNMTVTQNLLSEILEVDLIYQYFRLLRFELQFLVVRLYNFV